MKLLIGFIKKELHDVKEAGMWRQMLVEYTAKKGFLTQDDIKNMTGNSDNSIFCDEMFLRH